MSDMIIEGIEKSLQEKETNLSVSHTLKIAAVDSLDQRRPGRVPPQPS